MSKGVIIAGAGRGLLFARLIAAANPEFRARVVENGLEWTQIASSTNMHLIDRRVAAVVDINEKIHPGIRSELDGYGLTETAIYCTLEEALAKIPESEADAVMIITPNATHADLTELALRHHRHVFLEKPVATSWEEVRRIARAAADSPDRLVLPGFVLRHSAFYRRVKEICAGGSLGKIAMVQADERLFLEHSISYRRGWRRKIAATGGSMNEKCSHDLDILCWIKQPDAVPTAVFSLGGQVLFPPRPDTPENCSRCSDSTCPFRLTPEKLCCAQGSFKRDLGDVDRCVYHTDADVKTDQSATILFSDGSQAIFTMLMYSGKPGRTLLLHGTEGMLEGDFESGKITVHNYRTREELNYSIPSRRWHGGGDAMMLNDFFDSIDRGDTPISTLADGATATRLALAADRSAEEHRLVSLDEFPWPENCAMNDHGDKIFTNTIQQGESAV